ncbi:hypothetical protein HDU67_004380, partial [Dinochytrium kinnereticum]
MAAEARTIQQEFERGRRHAVAMLQQGQVQQGRGGGVVLGKPLFGVVSVEAPFSGSPPPPPTPPTTTTGGVGAFGGALFGGTTR